MESISHYSRPQPPCSSKFCNLFEKIVMRIKKEREPWTKLIDSHTGGNCSLDVSNTISKCESDLLHRGRAGLADVITTDGNRIPVRDLLRAISECICNQPH